MKKIVSVCLAGILLLCYSIYVFDARNPREHERATGGGTAGFTYLKKTPIYYGSESNVTVDSILMRTIGSGYPAIRLP